MDPLEANDVRQAMCPACGHHVAVNFLTAEQPLATLAWPKSAAEAQAMRRLPLDFVRCVDCGHVYNAAFRYQDVPYSEKPNLMFNRGQLWSSFIQGVQQEMLARIPKEPVVVEIGHGDGNFLYHLSELCPAGKFIGFDPHGATTSTGSVELRAELFHPLTHIPALQPDLVLSRHVLEHLQNPLGFLQQLSFAAIQAEVNVLAYFEVPCIDRVFATRRTVDFYYEHSSQFTTGSFTRMLLRSGIRVENIGYGYDGEVVYGFVRPGGTRERLDTARATRQFREDAALAEHTITTQLAELVASGKSIAIWGGTGKSAAFINRYHLDAVRFPLVVDSDQAKVDTFVPGTGQPIRFRDDLKGHAPDVLLIPPQWRARDIVLEMQTHHITAGQILIEHQGRLIDYHRDPHPYR